MTIEIFELELISWHADRTRTTRVGVEQELIVRDVHTGGTVDLERLTDAVADNEYAPYVTFEPGGQLELSLPVDRSANDAAESLVDAVTSVRRAAARDGIELLDDAVDTRPTVPRRLVSPRYDAMERHFDTIGPAGRVMMRRTASTQVCLDWWPGDEGWEQYRALLLSGPWIAAAYARGTGPGSRLATWLDVDPARTAFDGRLLDGEPAEAYARFAAGATRFAEPHDTTLFPPVRPRGHYLEVRYLDAQPMQRVEQAIETIATIAYDPEVRGRVLERLEPLAPRLGDCWRAAAYGGLDAAVLGSMNVLFVTDPLDVLLGDIDATVGLMTAVQAEGAEVWVCGPEDLAVVEGRLRAGARRVVLHERTRGDDHRWRIASPWYAAGATVVVDVAETFEVAMLRIDPPVDTRYLHTTYLLDVAAAAGVRVVNHPAGVRALHEKLLTLALPDLSPATVVGACPHLVENFVRRHGRAVLKPVDGFAGTDVWLVDSGPGCRALVESATHGGRRHVIAQEYLPAVAAGNKRLVLLDGEIVGAVLRRPGAEDFRIGAPVAEAEVDEADERIAAGLAPLLVGHGIAVAGVDVIDGRLIEVNVTCPGGMHKTDALLGTDLSGDIVRRLLDAGQRPKSEVSRPGSDAGERRAS